MHDSFVSVLSSGSCGNSFLVVRDGSAILVDAGLSARELERRMSVFGIGPSEIEAVVLTHEHTDHVRGARRFCADNRIKAFGTKGTLSLTPLEGVEGVPIKAGDTVLIGDLALEPFSVMHLAAEPVAFKIKAGDSSVAIASDLGCVTEEVVEHMRGVDLLMLEANYDEDMLANGSYPNFLKNAIRSKHGHLSNADAGLLSSAAVNSRTKDVVLVHLSMENNTPQLARRAVGESLRRARKKVSLHVAEHGAVGGPHRLA
ncbi:MAG: MBL fold metallo-hydrolase [Candidatus Thermoplasmatota archaeon]|nr:MBL fold metallo-hydrolase [Candidatus Thermoplasmatota archaeon]